MKAVLISIQPKWVDKIAIGEKTIEVRKTKPKLITPFKVYIYETNWRDNAYWKHKHKGRLGKVIGEFVCDTIYPISCYYSDTKARWIHREQPYTCLTDKEMIDYLGNGVEGYGWHITDLKIYDKPRELSEFFHYCGDDPKCDGCEAHYYSNTECGKEDYCCSIIEGCKPLKRPPQSWCYVEELKELKE